MEALTPQHNKWKQPNDAELHLHDFGDVIKLENFNVYRKTASPDVPKAPDPIYINCEVNGYPVEAIIDLGARTTTMSALCAKRCNITHLVEWCRVVGNVGVGVPVIIGRLPMVQMMVKHYSLKTSFAVTNDQVKDVVLNLDLLRRYECCIDLRKNVLRIGNNATETALLPQSAPRRSDLASDDDEYYPEIEPSMKLNYIQRIK